MADPLQYRTELRRDDVEAVRSLVTRTGVFSAEEADTAAELVSNTLDGTEFYQFILAEDDGGGLIAYSCFDRIPLSQVSFDLYWIVVSPAQQGAGVAAKLLGRTVATIRAQGCTQVFAETSSRAPYAAARRFYGKNGFEEAARFRDFYAPGDDKLVYRLWV